MKIKQVFLHIGLNKTGTTALQNFFKTNEEQLNKEGYYYPRTCRNKSGQHDFARALGFSEAYESAIGHHALVNMREELLHTAGNKIIISDENFCRNKSLDKVAEFFSEFEVRVIVYLRRHDQWLESYYNQALKMDAGSAVLKNFNTYFENQLKKNAFTFDYYKFLEKWSKVFGKEKIVVRLYEKNNFSGGTIFSDFFSVLGVQITSAYRVPKHDPNPKLSIKTVKILQKISELGGLELSRDQYKTLVKRLESKYNIDSNSRNYSLLTNEQRKQILELFHESNKKVFEEYFIGSQENSLFGDNEFHAVKPALDARLMDDKTLIKQLICL